MMSDDLRKFKEAINDLIAGLICEHNAKYFYGLTLSLFEFWLDPRMPYYAGIQPSRIILSPKFFKLEPHEQRFILCHEVGHYLRGHLKYSTQDALMNIAMDMIINDRLLDDGFKKLEDLYYLEDLKDLMPYKELKKLSEPEVRELLLKKFPKTPHGRSLAEDLGSGKCKSDGRRGTNPHNYQPSNKMKKLREGSFQSDNYFDNLYRLKDILEKLIKVAGREAGSFKELIDLEVKRPIWKIKLRRLLTLLTSKKSDLDLTKENRKCKDYFARKKSSQIKQIIVSLDTSGSMRPQELSEAISQILGFCRARGLKKIKLIQWDAKVQEVKDYRTTIKKLEVKGRGGTKLKPFLEWLKQFKGRSLVIIASDWYLFDEKEAKPMLRRLEKKHRIIGISTSDKNPLTKVKIKIE